MTTQSSFSRLLRRAEAAVSRTVSTGSTGSAEGSPSTLTGARRTGARALVVGALLTAAVQGGLCPVAAAQSAPMQKVVMYTPDPEPTTDVASLQQHLVLRTAPTSSQPPASSQAANALSDATGDAPGSAPGSAPGNAPGDALGDTLGDVPAPANNARSVLAVEGLPPGVADPSGFAPDAFVPDRLPSAASATRSHAKRAESAATETPNTETPDTETPDVEAPESVPPIRGARIGTKALPRVQTQVVTQRAPQVVLLPNQTQQPVWGRPSRAAQTQGTTQGEYDVPSTGQRRIRALDGTGPTVVDLGVTRHRYAADSDGGRRVGGLFRLTERVPELTKGAQGESIRHLQLELVRAGIPLTIDGVYGDETVQAIQVLQRRMNAAGFALHVDGIYGPMTHAAWLRYRMMQGGRLSR